jgi:hypothetical protein
VLAASAALAATSGLPVDPTITTFTNFISTDVAYGLVGAGFGGIAMHCVTAAISVSPCSTASAPWLAAVCAAS